MYVHNLPFELTWQELKDHMKTAGNVTRADVLSRPDGSSKVNLCRRASAPPRVRAPV